MPDEKDTGGLTASKLYRCPLDGAKDITAPEALSKLPNGCSPFCLAYTPDFCGFVTYRDGKFTSMDGKDIAPETVFELRCFCEDFDLRWVRDNADGTGGAVIISEKQFEGYEEVPCEFFKRQGRYLLWGKGAKRGDLTRLFEHRIGELPVPSGIEEKLKAGGQVWLPFDEFFSPDEYGNMVWRLERLKGLETE